MQLEAELAQPARRQALVDDIEGGGLLADEKDPLSLTEGLGYDVGDGLALPGAGRALHDERAATLGGFDASALRGIGVQDRVRQAWILSAVELFRPRHAVKTLVQCGLGLIAGQ